ncbi:DMT family transporter [Novipirellula artificiosorum]|uniref:EamA-like transporter family protein n=1 Tax=Novipirellula artificiosorum TaxID=2528016 RepID=A0A5C6D846_9BACT|nr:DMT family transporter [Novipirellula artificiosorum]TWU33010.1 EamA-like transporter family protein [Novipirellula artificiosorum]
MYLLLPFAASVLFVCGLIFVKRASEARIGPITILFCSNMVSSAAFSLLWLFGGPGQPWTMLWQPFLIAVIYMIGLTCTFSAVEHGDVSIATPVFGVKVVFVAFLLTLTTEESLSTPVWVAALLAFAGIVLIQWTSRGHRRRIVFTLVFALGAAMSFATFDCLVQRWSPAWGAGRFVPIVYWIVGVMSLAMIPWVQWSRFRDPAVRRSLLPGTTLVAMQALCIVLAVSVFGDAARVNVVYALRGLWGVGLAWLAARIWGGAEAEHGHRIMLQRAAGAVLLTIAVVLAILSH